MLTMKKLQQEILNLQNKLDCEKTKREKLEEISVLLEKIKHYIEKNPENKFTLRFDDLTEHKSIINVDNIENKKEQTLKDMILARWPK